MGNKIMSISESDGNNKAIFNSKRSRRERKKI
jgi:hypothetical protein